MPALLKPDSEIAASITCILSDVDGVMTDGRIVYDNQGVETKRFHVRDGLGIKAWMRSGFGFGILTARTSEIVRQRAGELGIENVQQGYEDKWPAAESMLSSMGYRPEQVCYIGDDLPDIAVMRRVALAVAPADAAFDAQEAAGWILRSGGGEGALRELIERLLRAKNRWEEHLRQ
ncbi:MAG: KdsC family phosphatase [Rubripirellula sp.]|jgi:3-deoxy-D-manno-octulosonate 8-phosphate phosphatase (KDO 8-P phosphatase)